MNWLTALKTFEWVVAQTSRTGAKIAEFRAEVALGSGEKITSAWCPIALLPLRRT
jgi:hypothetical protein